MKNDICHGHFPASLSRHARQACHSHLQSIPLREQGQRGARVGGILGAAFGGKVKMLSAEEVVAVTGHPIGGVCPFGLASPLPVYCDVSLKSFDEVVPAAGSTHSALRINPLRMAALVGAVYIATGRKS